MALVVPTPAEMEARKKAQANFKVIEFNWLGQDDLIAAAADNFAVQCQERSSMHSINPEQTFKQLMQCADLLQVALTAAGREKCSIPITRIISKYQDTLTVCVQTSGSFVDACIMALKFHKLVQKAFEKGKPALAFKQYEKCAELAHQMADGAKTVADQVGVLKDDATEALVQAKEDMVGNAAEKDRIEQMLVTARADEAKMNSQLSSLAAELDEVKEEESKLAAAASAQRDRAFTMEIVGAIVGGVAKIATGVVTGPAGAVAGMLGAGDKAQAPAAGQAAAPAAAPSGDGDMKEILNQKREVEGNLSALKSQLSELEKPSNKEAATPEGKKKIGDLKDQITAEEAKLQDMKSLTSKLADRCSNRAESLEAKEACATARKRELNNMEREQNAQLKQTVEEMKGMTTKKSKVEQTLLCLDTTFKTMGQIKTAFNKVEAFWRAVAGQCDQLAKLKDVMADEFELADSFEDIRDSFQSSAIQWAALGMVNYKAHMQMIHAKEGVDSKMCALPGGEVNPTLVDNMVKAMALSLDENDHALLGCP